MTKKSSDKIVKLRHADIELDKRTYLPFRVESKCPDCGRIAKRDLTEDYLSYPTTGVAYSLGFSHDDDKCANDWEVDVVVGLTLELA